MKTHTVYYIDKYGRQIFQTYTKQEYKRALPELLEHGLILGIQYFVTTNGETRQLDYYNGEITCK